MQTPSDARHLRNALGTFATGVTIVTTHVDGVDVGLTANSFSSVSLEPPLVLWSLAKRASSLPAFMQAGYFAVHVLASDQEHLSQLFATRGADRFAGLEVERGEASVPLLPGCAARFLCRSTFQYEGGDHIIFVGEVVEFEHASRPPLLFHGGRYALAARRAEALAELEIESDADQLPPTGFGEDLLGYLVGRAHHQLYAPIRRELAQHGLTEADHFVLSVLGISDGRTPAEINAIIDYTGHRLTGETAARLQHLGFIGRDTADDGNRLWLSSAGRQALIRLIAAAKASEADALSAFDDEEARLLRHLLKRLIRATDPGVPNLWRR